MRLIDADAMLETLKRKYPQWYTGKPKDSWMHYAWLVYHQAVENAPTIDVAPVQHGRWSLDTAHTEEIYAHPVKCSVCGRTEALGYETLTPYCPYCGARMDGESND